jgi:hypothetical protein
MMILYAGLTATVTACHVAVAPPVHDPGVSTPAVDFNLAAPALIRVTTEAPLLFEYPVGTVGTATFAPSPTNTKTHAPLVAVVMAALVGFVENPVAVVDAVSSGVALTPRRQMAVADTPWKILSPVTTAVASGLPPMTLRKTTSPSDPPTLVYPLVVMAAVPDTETKT